MPSRIEVKLRSKVASNAPIKTRHVVYNRPVSTEVDALRTVCTPLLEVFVHLYERLGSRIHLRVEH